MWWYLLIQIISGILGIWLAQKFVHGVAFFGPVFVFPKETDLLGPFLDSLFFVGGLLGFLNYFVKPILNKIALPLRIVTLNLFSLVIAMAIIWVVDVFSPKLVINGLKPLFITTIIVWLLNFIFSKWWPEPKHSGSSFN